MAKLLKTSSKDFKTRLHTLLHYEEERSDVLQLAVSGILKEVKSKGDAAVIGYSNKWDKTAFKKPADFVLKANPKCLADVVKALELSAARIRAYHEQQLPKDHWYTDKTGTKLGWKWTPIERVGLYVPGGKAAYPSSVLMNAIPAVVAGVKELAMVVPTPGGEINPAVIAAAKIAGVKEIYAIGGAQAVGALARAMHLWRKQRVRCLELLEST